jgi:hypothetical protein
VNTCGLDQCAEECPRLGCYIGRRWAPGFGAEDMPAKFALTMPEPLERDIHEAVASVLDERRGLLRPPAFAICYPAGIVELSPQQAARYVACGLKSGMPDWLIFYRGVYLIELKRRGGQLSQTRIVKTKRGALREIVGQRERFKQLYDTGAVIDGAICYSVQGVVDKIAEWGIPLRGRIAA